MKKSRIDIAGSIVSPLAVMLMELCWVYPWLIWSREVSVLPWDTTPLHFLSLFGVIVVSFAINRFIPSLTTLLRLLKFALVIVTVLAVMNIEYGGGLIPFSGGWFTHLVNLVIDSFNNLHPAVAGLTALVYLAVRGSRIAVSTTFSIDVFKSFLLSLGGLVLLIVVWALSMGKGSTESLITNAGVFIAGFFFFGLASLAMGNFLSIRQKLMKEKSTPLSNGRWFTVLIGVIGGMVVIAVAVSALFSPSVITSITSGIGSIVYFLNYGLEIIFIPLGYVIELIWAIMTYLVSLIKAPEAAEFLVPEITDIEGIEETMMSPSAGFDVMVVVKWAVFLALLGFVIWLIYRSTKRYRKRAYDAGYEEFSESLWSWLGFTRDIRLFFSNLFDRWFGSRLRKLQTNLSKIGHGEESFRDDMPVREIYGRMLREAQASGHGRRFYETPYEFADRLESRIPDIGKEVDDMTDLYVHVRYGEKQLKSWEQEHANVVWRLIHRVLHKPDSEK